MVVKISIQIMKILAAGLIRLNLMYVCIYLKSLLNKTHN